VPLRMTVSNCWAMDVSRIFGGPMTVKQKKALLFEKRSKNFCKLAYASY